MDIRQIRYFIEVARQGNFTRASERLHIAQPSLSYQIRRLEEELQVSLFSRSSRGVELTLAGHVLLDEGESVVNSMETLRRRLLDVAAVARGQVSVGLTPSIAERILVPLLQETRMSHSWLTVNIVEDLSSKLTAMIEDGQLDIALAYDVTPRPGLSLRKVEIEPIGLATARSGHRQTGGVFEFRNITSHPLVLQKKPHRLRQVLEQVAAQQELELTIAYEIQSGPTIFRMVEQGLGEAICSMGSNIALQRDHRIDVHRFVNPEIYAELFLLRSSARPPSRPELIVEEIVVRLLGQREMMASF